MTKWRWFYKWGLFHQGPAPGASVRTFGTVSSSAHHALAHPLPAFSCLSPHPTRYLAPCPSPALPQLSPLIWFCPLLGSRCSDFPTPHSLLTYISWYPANYVHLLNQAPRARKFERLNNYLLVTNVPSHALGHRPRRNSWLIGEMRLTSPYQFGGPWHRVLMK